MTKLRTIWAAGLIALLLLAGCIEDGQVNVYLVKSPELSKAPLGSGFASHVRVRVTGPGMHPMERVSPYKEGGATSVPEIPQGKDRVITVEGLESADGIAMSRGRSLPIDIDGGKQSVTIFIARVTRFSVAPNNGLKGPRFGHTIVSDDTGYLYIAGGASAGDVTTPETFRQDPVVLDPSDVSVRSFPCGSDCELTKRAFGVAVPVADGFLLTGGIGEEGALVQTVDFIDMEAETVRTQSIDLSPRSYPSAIVFDAETVIAGGLDKTGQPSALVEIVGRDFNVEKRSLPAPRYGMASGRAGNKGLFFGGYGPDGSVSGDVYLFDADSNIVSTLDADLTPRAHAATVSLSDGRLLILGGVTDDGRASRDVDLFDPAVGAICNVGRLAVGRWHLSAALMPDGVVLAVGGLTGSLPGQATQEVSLLDPRYTSISSDCGGSEQPLIDGEMEQIGNPRYFSTAVLMENGNVAIIGGLNGHNVAQRQIEVYVPPEE